MRGLQRGRVGDELLRRADLAATGDGIGVAEEQIAREVDHRAQLAAEQRMHGNAELLPDDVEAGELDRGVELRPVVVQARRRIADLEAQRQPSFGGRSGCAPQSWSSRQSQHVGRSLSLSRW